MQRWNLSQDAILFFIIALAHISKVKERDNIVFGTLNAEEAIKNSVHIHDNSSQQTRQEVFFLTLKTYLLKVAFHGKTLDVFFFFLTSLLEYNCFTMVCQFLLYNKVNQLYIYIYPHIQMYSYSSQGLSLLFNIALEVLTKAKIFELEREIQNIWYLKVVESFYKNNKNNTVE